MTCLLATESVQAHNEITVKLGHNAIIPLLEGLDQMYLTTPVLYPVIFARVSKLASSSISWKGDDKGSYDWSGLDKGRAARYRQVTGKTYGSDGSGYDCSARRYLL